MWTMIKAEIYWKALGLLTATVIYAVMAPFHILRKQVGEDAAIGIFRSAGWLLIPFFWYGVIEGGFSLGARL